MTIVTSGLDLGWLIYLVNYTYYMGLEGVL